MNRNEKQIVSEKTDADNENKIVSKITTAIVFDHRGRAGGGKGQVEIRVSYGRKSYYFSTGVKCHKSEFVAGQIINCAGAKELNERVAIVYKKVCACVNESIERDGLIDTEDVKRQVWKIVETHSDEPTLLNWIDRQIQILDVSDGTRKHYVSLQNRLEQYGRLRRWEDVTIEGIVNFDAWLHSLNESSYRMGATAHGRLRKGLSDGAVYTYHKCLKALLRRADMFGKIERSPYERLHGRFKRGERENVEYLTEKEMSAIEQLEYTDGTTLCKCRDLFVLQMYTGLSYSDMQAFDISDYKEVEGVWVNNGERIKTGVNYLSVLLPPVVKVLEKYKWKVPKVENHVYNRMLKTIGEAAKIKIPLHSHLARHSFATFMLSNGVPIEHVSKMVGHTNITQTQRYAKVLAKDVRNDFNRIASQFARP